MNGLRIDKNKNLIWNIIKSWGYWLRLFQKVFYIFFFIEFNKIQSIIGIKFTKLSLLTFRGTEKKDHSIFNTKQKINW